MSNPLDSRYRAMKKLPILLCIFLLSACAPSEVPSDKLVERNGIKYEINSQIPFTGVATVYYENGQLMSKLTYKDGKQNGLIESYYDNGQLESKGNWKGGKLNGIYEGYRENGQLEFKDTYKDGKQNGLARMYYENGQLMIKGTYKDGEPNGLFEYYRENGQEESFSPGCFQNGEDADISICKSL